MGFDFNEYKHALEILEYNKEIQLDDGRIIKLGEVSLEEVALLMQMIRNQEGNMSK